MLKKLTIELIRRCPNRCLHCSTGSSPLARDEISFAEVCRIVGQAKLLGLQKVILSGGEPLIYADLVPLVNYLRDQQLDVVIYTSGSSLTQEGPVTVPNELMQSLLRNRCRFNLSLHSHISAVHDRFMDTPGSWDRAVDFLRTVSALGCQLDVHTVLTKINFDRLPELAEFLHAFSVRSWRLLRLVPQGRARTHFRELELSSSDWGMVDRQLQELRATISAFSVRLGAHLPTSLAGHSYECSLDQDKLLIEPNGIVSICPALKGARAIFPPPNARSDALVQILTGEWHVAAASLKSAVGHECPAQSLYRSLQQTNAELEEALVHGQEQTRN